MNNANPDLPKVLYIMGTARSGSTILEILLSKGKGVFGAGELTSLIQDGFIENKQCSCGSSCADCDVWGRVSEILKLDKQELEEWAALQKKMDWHDGFLRQLFSMVSRKDTLSYRELNTRLLMVIKEVTGCNIILDSSKYAGRAIALARIVDADVRVICLTRSPAGLMASFQKPNKEEQRPKRPAAALLYYLVTLASLRIASALSGRRVYRLSYEALLANPNRVLREIEAWSGVDLSDVRGQLNKEKPFPVGHLVTGNRLRKQGEVRFEPRMNNAAPAGLKAKAAVVVMNGWRWMLGF